jgi:hypothetical protein
VTSRMRPAGRSPGLGTGQPWQLRGRRHAGRHFRDASGDTNTYAPELAYNINIDYRVPVFASLEARGVLNINYSDEYFNAADLDPIYGRQDSYTTYDLRLSLGRQDGVWDVALVGRNLTDELISGNNDDQPLVPGAGFRPDQPPALLRTAGDLPFLAGSIDQGLLQSMKHTNVEGASCRLTRFIPKPGIPLQAVPRAAQPLSRVHDLALIELEGPDLAGAEQFFTRFGLTLASAEDDCLCFSAEAGAPVALVYRRANPQPFHRPDLCGPRARGAR